MNNKPIDPDFEVLLTSTMYLLSRNQEAFSEKLSQQISEHFALLINQAEIESYPTLKQHCLNLFKKWRAEKPAMNNTSDGLFPTPARLH